MPKLHALAFGTDVGAPAANATADSQDEIATAIRLTLSSIAEKPNYAPRRPLLLPKLVQAMNDDDVSRRELARIVADDPALAANLLRLANSSFYRISAEPIESLDRAVALLGIEGMRSMVATALLQPVFRVSDGQFAGFADVTWEHTLRAAQAAEAHAAIIENGDPFAAQLLALLMGLATIVVFRVATDAYAARRRAPQAAVIAAMIDCEAAPVARQTAASWELSERIDAALSDQSAPEGDDHRGSLGRSLRFGRFMGALAVLRARAVIDDDTVKGALQTGGDFAAAYERIWTRLTATPR